MDLTHLLHLTMEPLQPMDVTLAIHSLAVQQGHVLELIVGVALLLVVQVHYLFVST